MLRAYHRTKRLSKLVLERRGGASATTGAMDGETADPSRTFHQGPVIALGTDAAIAFVADWVRDKHPRLVHIR